MVEIIVEGDGTLTTISNTSLPAVELLVAFAVIEWSIKNEPGLLCDSIWTVLPLKCSKNRVCDSNPSALTLPLLVTRIK